MGESTLENAKKDYEKAREAERISLSKFLGEYEGIKDILRIVTGGRAGRGWMHYTSGTRLKEYDLSNWKWVEVTDDGDFDCIVSLNMIDTDPGSGNTHVLFDRVGLLISYHKGEYYYETAVHTNINLPLNPDEPEIIAQLVIEQYEAYKESKGTHGR